MDTSPRELRLSSAIRAAIIGALIAVYAYVLREPGATFTASLLVAAGLQVVVLLLRKFVPTYLMPQALHVFELMADAATVFLFALGVFGGILRTANAI
jgi:nucleoside recognition membrane protein YjiH